MSCDIRENFYELSQDLFSRVAGEPHFADLAKVFPDIARYPGKVLISHDLKVGFDTGSFICIHKMSSSPIQSNSEMNNLLKKVCRFLKSGLRRA